MDLFAEEISDDELYLYQLDETTLLASMSTASTLA